MSESKDRKFLKPLTVAVAAVVATAATNAVATEEVHAAVEKVSEPTVEQTIVQEPQDQLILQAVDSDGNKTSYHGSHASHSSHSSHSSSSW